MSLKAILEADDDEFACSICGELVSDTVKCSNNDLFCIDCIGAFTDALDSVTEVLVIAADDSNQNNVDGSSEESGDDEEEDVDDDEANNSGAAKGNGGGSGRRNGHWSWREVEETWTKDVIVKMNNGNVVVTHGYTADSTEHHPSIQNAVKQTTNSCPQCEVVGAYCRSTVTDRALANLLARCPFVADGGHECLWTGPLIDFRTHEHTFLETPMFERSRPNVPPYDEDRPYSVFRPRGPGSRDDGAADVLEQDLEKTVIVDGKVVKLEKRYSRNSKELVMTVMFEL